MTTESVYYRALVAKNPSFEGTFVAAVKTTGIFCRPTCRARKPKKENVEFFRTAAEAMQRGYRPCRVCHPLEKPHETPAPIRKLIREIGETPSVQLRDHHLRQRGLEPNTLRRWFLKNHGITFHAYQRMIRINTAFKKIREGDTVGAAAFDAGFESLSGFGDTFKSIFGVSPSGSRERTMVDITRIETPLGTMIAGATEKGICLLEFTDRKMLETQLKTLAHRLNATILQGNNPHFDHLKKELGGYFDGTLKKFSVPLFTPGTEFQQEVWRELRRIPYGKTRSYLEQARAVGKPEAVRAVAHANGMNRIAILIPCHRVIGADGGLTGYGGGLWRKKWLLDLELSHP
ncbi:MAG TPA: methylated-DNA--[protein]-cysteine S-methyltransferase [Bacteroidota bacterium]|nr:methylated-DNA--[protein]-cysteine S-methyltransferase [Bacteroidota bacterium]